MIHTLKPVQSGGGGPEKEWTCTSTLVGAQGPDSVCKFSTCKYMVQITLEDSEFGTSFVYLVWVRGKSPSSVTLLSIDVFVSVIHETLFLLVFFLHHKLLDLSF